MIGKSLFPSLILGPVHRALAKEIILRTTSEKKELFHESELISHRFSIS
jgi:hypothetical protein